MVTPSFTRTHDVIAELDFILKRAEAPSGSIQWTAVSMLQDARDNFFPTLQFLIDLGELQHPLNGTETTQEDFDQSFWANFRLGPHGLHPIIGILKRVYNLVVAQRHRVSSIELSLQVETINAYAALLLSLLQHFRTSVDRVEYDPLPFAELRRELQTGSNKFAVCHLFIDRFQADA